MTGIGAPPHATRLWRARDRPELTVVAELAADFVHRQMFPPLGTLALSVVPETTAFAAS